MLIGISPTLWVCTDEELSPSDLTKRETWLNFIRIAISIRYVGNKILTVKVQWLDGVILSLRKRRLLNVWLRLLVLLYLPTKRLFFFHPMTSFALGGQLLITKNYPNPIARQSAPPGSQKASRKFATLVLRVSTDGANYFTSKLSNSKLLAISQTKSIVKFYKLGTSFP